jgi:superfamily II DNA or RNA helicase
VPAIGGVDGSVTVDLVEHGADRGLLETLGMSDIPVAGIDPQAESWFADYRHAAWQAMCEQLAPGVTTPRLDSVTIGGANPPGPLGVLAELSEAARHRYIAHLPLDALVRDWTARGNRQTHQAQVDSPLVWMAWKHGYLQTSVGLVGIDLAVGPGLSEHREVLPVAEVDRVIADALQLPSTIEEIPDSIWEYLVKTVAATDVDGVPGRVYALFLRSGAEWPGGATRCRIGAEWTTQPDERICVTADRTEYESLLWEKIPALLVPTPADVDAMVERWEMRRYAAMVARELRKTEESEPVAVIDEFPHLRHLRGQKADGWAVVRCSELAEAVRTPHGTRIQEMSRSSRDRVVYVHRPSDDTAVLEAISRELGLRLTDEEIAMILVRREAAKGQELLTKVRRTADLAEKLVLLLGAERLRRGLPEGILSWERNQTNADPDDHRIAELALHAHGDEVLRHYRRDLELASESLRRTFTGDTASRQTVADLNFPAAFAGVREESPLPVEQVSGPTPHFPLHDYQERLAEKMLRMLMQPTPGRAMLSLPTGAGKTRIAAEAVIRYIKRHGESGLSGPILWIAQSDELCEQAVQSWRYVWEKVGAAQTRLTISRFWSGRDATPVTDNPHLVVATDDKLTANLRKAPYGWLREPALVIIDEAHAAISPSYTRILEYLGLPHHRTSRPLIGLTATPFRGRNEDETKRLVGRFGGARLDDGVFDGSPYKALQHIGVLAHVDHRILEGGRLELTPDEISDMVPGGNLPKSAEQRLGEDHNRNRALLDAVTGLDREWPVLLFATSVTHARFLATLFNDHDITAASVDAETPPARRRQIIDHFRTGRIRVVTNYGVLHQGFDAPATRAVVVARPTYSPNVYQQMIGRGLRGPQNGGEERCLILNVRDNIVNYGENLAFTGFEHLWAAA